MHVLQVTGNHRTKRLEANFRPRKCLHFYHYQIHLILGFMHARIQTWFPFTVYVCINGREWLARQMDQVGLHYRQRDNTFTWLEDIAQTQALFDQQLQANWFQLLGDQASVIPLSPLATTGRFGEVQYPEDSLGRPTIYLHPPSLNVNQTAAFPRRS